MKKILILFVVLFSLISVERLQKILSRYVSCC